MVLNGFPRWQSGKQPTCQCSRLWFDPWVRKIPWRKKWQPTPVFLPGKSHGQKSLTGYSPWDHKDSDTTEHAHIVLKKRSMCEHLYMPKTPQEIHTRQ